MSVGLPSSTPAFQAAAMYGVAPDIPGFHYYDRRTRVELHFPRPGAADLVEQRLAEGRRGILEGGACYGCVFTGGASESLLTFARLLKPTRAGLPLLRLPLSLAMLGRSLARCLWRTGLELGRFLTRAVVAPFKRGSHPLRWLGLKILFSIWVREHFTLAVSADLYRGLPAIYVNYLDYDVFAHSFGPTHHAAMRALRRVDTSIGHLARVIARLPELGYDLYVCSDHGQIATRPFAGVAGGQSIDQVVRHVLAETGAENPSPRAEDREGSVPARPPAAVLDDAIRVIAAGPNAFVYFTDSAEPLRGDDIDARYPGAMRRLSVHPGIGLVLARSRSGAICWWRGRRLSLRNGDDAGPFEGRSDRETVLADLRALMAMPSAGDLVLYGNGAAAGDISFIDEHGAHAGPSEDEMATFILHPPSVELPEAPLTHPIQLYDHFAAYARGGAVGAHRTGRAPDRRPLAAAAR